MKSYKQFIAELETHSAPGYHSRMRPQDTQPLLAEAARLGWHLRGEYVDFMTQVGSGRYFGGDLVIYPFEGEPLSVIAATNQLQSVGIKSKMAFAYDGTTEGCFCLSVDGRDGVYWANWIGDEPQLEAPNLYAWLEQQPSLLFNERSYRAYRTVKDPQAIAKVIEARRTFKVKLLRFDRSLGRPPGKEADFLPRYHKLTFEIQRSGTPELDYLTVKCRRTGSSVGNDNIEYVSLPVADLRPVETKTMEAFLFDPFNVPFEAIEAEYDPEINLSEPSKIKYKEIGPYI